MKNCEYYEKQIDLLLDGMLTPSEENELRMHLDTCSACAETEHQLREIRASIAEMDYAEIPAELHERIMAVLPAAQSPKKNRIHARWIRGLAAAAACALLGLAILRLPRMGSTAGDFAGCADTAAPESFDDGSNTGTGAYGTNAAEEFGGSSVQSESSGDTIAEGDKQQENMVAPSIADAQLTQKAGEGINEATLPACAAAYAYAGNLTQLRIELEGFDAAFSEEEDDRVLLMFETGSEAERTFLDRLTALGFKLTELPKDGYTLDISAPYSLYILMQK